MLPQSNLPEPIDIQFTEKLQCLFEPWRYKVLWGGRAAGRSWGVARALLLLGMRKPLRVLCARELQNSLTESVHKLLSDQINLLGLGNFWDVQVGRIFSRPGVFFHPDRPGSALWESSFSFEGIKNNTTAIKSYEGIDYCWVEEANKVSKSSWQVLIPTIRNPGSEIWLTFNPDLKTDFTYKHFVLRESANKVVVHMTYRDNPWISSEMLGEMEEMKADDEDDYLNIWEGQCRVVLDGVVYAKEIRRAMKEGRITRVRYDPSVPVLTFFDLGRADKTAIWFVQIVGQQFRVIDYFEDSGEDITYYLRHMQGMGYVFGDVHLPHDAKAKRLGSKRTIEEVVKAAGYRVRIVAKLSLTDGINAARMVFRNCYFDEKATETGLDRLRHYRYKVVEGQYSSDPVHDEHSDGADAFRYMGIALKSPDQKGTGKIRRLLGLSEEAEFPDPLPSRDRWSQRQPETHWLVQ